MTTLVYFAAMVLMAETFYLSSDAPAPDGGIYLLQAGKDGTLSIQEEHTPLPHVAYLCLDAPRRRLFAAISSSPGKLASFAITEQGTLQPIGVTESGGKVSCHITVSPNGRFVYSADYSSGSVTEFEISGDGRAVVKKIITHPGRGATMPRQEMAHPHFSTFTPDQTMLVVVDLGLDQIFFYHYDPENGVEVVPAQIVTVHPGAGPRHLIFGTKPDTFYTVNELDSTVSRFVLHDQRYQERQILSSRPDGEKGKNYPGSIKLSQDGRILFVTNRGDETIACFAIDPTDALVLREILPSGGKYPTDILETANGLLCVNRTSHNITLNGVSVAGPIRFPSCIIRAAINPDL